MCRVTRLAPSASLTHDPVHCDFSLVLAYQCSEHRRVSALTLYISPMEQTYLIDGVRRGVGHSLEEAPPTALGPDNTPPVGSRCRLMLWIVGLGRV
jgi:hypothetical protein